MLKSQLQKLFSHPPTRISLGLGLALWLITANSYNASSTLSPASEPTLNKQGESDSQLLNYSESDYLNQQRELFQQADKALQLGRVTEFRRLIPDLTDYPLYSYLIYQDMRRDLSRQPAEKIDNFLKTYEGSIIAKQFRRDLIRHYGKNKQWSALIEIYKPQQSISLRCKYLYAQLQNGAKDTAFTEIEKLWLSASSRPRSCDKVFDLWQQAGQQTQELIWERIQLAMSKGRIRLARHLAKQLDEDKAQWFELWLKVHRQPEDVLQSDLLKQDHPLSNTIRLHALKRLSRKDSDQAIVLWMKLDQSYGFSETDLYKSYEYIGLAKARQHQPGASFWLNLIPEQYSNRSIQEWRIRSAIRQADWTGLVQAIEQMPPHQQAKLRWQYWWAYANLQLGYSKAAEGAFHNLASRRSFYGFLAADHLQLPYSFEERPLQLNEDELIELSVAPQAIRARELFRLQRIPEARREWHQLMAELDEQQKLVASQLAHSWGWHDRAIYTMGRTDYRDDIALRFPLPLPLTDMVSNWSQQHDIEPALTYAIIRRESAFMSDAKSSKGALGLMQIRPGTARQVSRRMKVRYRGKHSLLKTDTNLKLGTRYLQQMLKRHENQPVLATAAYNAGPHRVKAWLPEDQPMEAIRWVETIPFRETREYVSNVLAYTVIYEHVLGSETRRLEDRMPPVPSKDDQSQSSGQDQSLNKSDPKT